MKRLKRLLCKHKTTSLIRWCIRHIPEHEPSCAVVEHKCNECGRYIYKYLTGEDKRSWIEAMGENNKQDFYSER